MEHEWGKLIAIGLQLAGVAFILYGLSIAVWWWFFDENRLR